jgi:hypothetical protein
MATVGAKVGREAAIRFCCKRRRATTKSMTPAGYIPEEQPEVLAAKMIEFFEQDGL